MHEPTGLYTQLRGRLVPGRGRCRQRSFAGLHADDDSTFWAVEAGIQKKWIDLGPTTIFGQYYDYDGGANARQAVARRRCDQLVLPARLDIFTSEVEMFGLGIAQDIKAADMKLYALYRHYEADVTLSQRYGWFRTPIRSRISTS